MSGSQRVAVVGATGYAGFELAKLLLRHPKVEQTTFLVREGHGNVRCLSELFPQRSGWGDAPWGRDGRADMPASKDLRNGKRCRRPPAPREVASVRPRGCSRRSMTRRPWRLICAIWDMKCRWT